MATIAEIARAAGVSKATVSRVVNGHPDVDPRTAERVRQEIGRAGYVPRASARALARGRARCIGLQVPTLTLPWMLELLRGVAEAAETSGYTLTLHTTTRGADSLRNFAAQAEARVVDGLIVIVPHGLEDEILRLASDDFPVISVDDHEWDLPVVITTQYAGSRAAATHLIDHGHVPIAHITGPRDGPATQPTLSPRSAFLPEPDAAEPIPSFPQGVRDRIDGFDDAVRRADLDPGDALSVESDWTTEGGAEAMREILRRRPDVRGVFASNDLMAIGAMAALADAGRRVPVDVAVVGFDDIPAAAHTTPALTTVRQPLFEMGHTAAAHLIARLEDGVPIPPTTTLPASLVIRHSCGARQRQPLPA